MVGRGSFYFEELLDFIEADSKSAAERVAKTIYDAIDSLTLQPGRGRPGWVPGTRELVLSPLPYIVTYEVVEPHVLVLRIRHGAMKPL